MTVGISLLTFVPGELGGSETYVRELLRNLARDGQHSYRVLLPSLAPELGARVSRRRSRRSTGRDGRSRGACSR